MSDKEPVVDEVAQSDDYLPEEEGVLRAKFLAGIEVAREQARRGEDVSIEETRKHLEKWVRQ